MKKNIKYITASIALTGILGLSGVVCGGTNSVQVMAQESDSITDTSDSDEYIYCVASISKVYVTAAVMQLVDEGKVNLDSPVTEYLTDFKMKDVRYKDITVRMLMNHTSGIMGTTNYAENLYEDGNMNRHDKLLEYLTEQRLKADPGEYAAYCNDGFELLMQIVERVSGMPYTEYIEKNLAAPTGGTTTGTFVNMYNDSRLVPCYDTSYLRYDHITCTGMGDGGVYSTASDVANFGASFFKGDNTLLSEKSKNDMSTIWGGDEYSDVNGLGWDEVGLSKYDAAGVQVLGKGGDTGSNHGWLMVAPDEDVSISVLSNGGNSVLDSLVAQAIMEAVLEEKGINVSDVEKTHYEVVSEIPAEYDEYAGCYILFDENSMGETIGVISFPDHKYMHVESIGPFKTKRNDYMLTTDGKFVELSYEIEDDDISEAKTASNPKVLSFVKQDDGNIYIGAEAENYFPDLGIYENSSYIGEKMADSDVNSDILEKWTKYSGKEYLLSNEIYSSIEYANGADVMAIPSEVMPGYVYAYSRKGVRVLAIKDAETAVSFQTIPSSSSRDQIDLTYEEDKAGGRLFTSDGHEYISAESIPTFDNSITEVELKTGEAFWYSISDSMANKTVSVTEKPENSSIFVYNKYGEVVYNSHVKDAKDELPLPRGGRVVILGEDGGKVTFN